MSLADCIREAGNTVQAAAPNVRAAQLDALKEQLWLHISSDELARLSADNPARAENEIRSIARQVFARGLLPGGYALSDRERRDLVEALLDALFGLGPIEELLADEGVTEIMVNGSRSIFCERAGVLEPFRKTFGSDDEVRAVIDRIIGPLGRRIDESSPMVNARLPEGHRVHAIIPPLSLDGPILTIRKFTARVITLDRMVRLRTLDESVRRLLGWAVRARVSIAVSGGTGTGKTTLLNALSCEISPDERILTIEDSAELRFTEHPHVVRLEARPANAEGTGQVTIRDLVTNALRMRPDRIVVGECRGAEALDMLQAMNTGHDGSMTTLHANSPADAISRLTVMVRYAADLPVDVIEQQAASALDLILQVTRAPTGERFLSKVVSVDYSRADRAMRLNALYEREYFDEQGRWVAAPSWLGSLAREQVASEGEVRAWMSKAGLSASAS